MRFREILARAKAAKGTEEAWGGGEEGEEGIDDVQVCDCDGGD